MNGADAAVYGTGANDSWHRGQACLWHQEAMCRVSAAVNQRQGLVETGVPTGSLLLAPHALPKKEPTKMSKIRQVACPGSSCLALRANAGLLLM